MYPGFESCVICDAGGLCSVLPSVGGIDFGFHNPSAFLWGHVDHDGILWITGARYKSQCTLPVHSAALPVGVEWYADPAGAESIAQLRQSGHSVRPCVHMPTRGASGEKKNPKLSGIDMVSRRIANGTLRIVRCPETMPLIRELGMYHYDELKKLEEPVDEDNHACDALRYLIVGLDRHRMPSVIEPETEEQVKAKEAADKKAEHERRRKLDEEAQQDPDLDRWFNS